MATTLVSSRPISWATTEAARSIASRTVAQATQGAAVAPDSDVITAGDALPQDQQFGAFKDAITGHNYIHQYLSGTIGTEHVASGDPFFLLLHSNVDRLWAMWQRAVV